ncbi:division/cell wall cluster transcriptional repressor MraZ [Luteolibacter algae]|uniref:Division/cell wall cluster transcriptional repressor MraZ n=1 Tax=Luteolibacter algae TaxID=454151 RepID=A0ABW5D6Y4_9BACT
MIPQFQQYKGSFPYKTDSKNRVNVVPAWRPAQGEPVNLMPSISEGVKILKVLTQEAFEYRVERIKQHAESPKQESQMKTKLVRMLREVSVNDQGKLLIPKDLAEYAGIAPDSEVMLSAGDSHFEIWNRDKFEEIFGLSPVPEDEDHLAIF